MKDHRMPFLGIGAASIVLVLTTYRTIEPDVRYPPASREILRSGQGCACSQ